MKTSTLPSSITTQIRNAAMLAAQIEAVAKHLAELMDQLHGEECKYSICHDAGSEVICISPGMKRGGSSRDLS